MRVMVIIKATEGTEAGVMPDNAEELLTEMGAFNEALVKAGVMLAGEGLHPSAKGKRVRFSRGGAKSVVDGPFAETKELIAGFWLWNVKSMEEALDWVKRMPAPHGDAEDAEVEIRPVFETEDFGAELTPELRAQEDRLRTEVAAQKK
ncbi:MAG: YciI family protein [Myxococcota bacterium]|nr:YciI family protein [Myxococcota bacterium]